MRICSTPAEIETHVTLSKCICEVTVRVVYGLFALTVLVVATLLTTIILLFVPGLRRRRRIARNTARAVLWLAAIKVHVRGRVPHQPCTVVANHASYIDGIVLFAVLPPDFSFAIKREITRLPVAGLLLRRIGMQFVERFDTRRGAVDARRLIRNAQASRYLAGFPEGTFRAEPGLGRFHNGLFRAATGAGLDIVPATILGTRRILPANRRLPVPGSIEIVFHDTVAVGTGGGVDAVTQVRDVTRAAILSALNEPELAFVLEA